MKSITFYYWYLLCYFPVQNNRIGFLSNDSEISFDINGQHYAHIGEQTVANGGIEMLLQVARQIWQSIPFIHFWIYKFN